MISLVFDRKELRRLAVNWEDFVSGFLSIFRGYYGRYVDDEWYNLFLNDMMNRHPDFQALWKQSGVSSALTYGLNSDIREQEKCCLI